MSGTAEDIVQKARLDKELISRFKRVQELPAEEKKTVLSFLGTFIAKGKIQTLLRPK